MEKAVNQKSTWIMDCPNEYVIDICRRTIELIEDLKQTEMTDFDEELESLQTNIEANMKVSELMEQISSETRKEIRFLTSNVLRIASLYVQLY
jgi:hypothetical protein